ncbi:MAG: hypothetical protein GEV10_25300 [Streptosporangiales bacterium]|nr:hypothetical protein [Streptosporangiales bacterium]
MADRKKSPSAEWQRLAAELRTDLPGDWSLRGKGRMTKLVREPVDWRLCWVGFGKSAYSSAGWLYAAVQPLCTYFGGPPMSLNYGIRMDDVEGGPSSVDLTEPGAGDVVRDFLAGPAPATFDEWPLELFGTASERNLARPRDERGTPRFWLLAPGCRVVLDTGSPVEPAREAAAYHLEWEDGTAEEAAYYAGLADAFEAGGRDKALAYLEDRKEAMLVAADLATRRE